MYILHTCCLHTCYNFLTCDVTSTNFERKRFNFFYVYRELQETYNLVNSVNVCVCIIVLHYKPTSFERMLHLSANSPEFKVVRLKSEFVRDLRK